ncbi:MAG: hypothetical protein EBU66_19245 [Bacteroidetes bacterium]|nr:hypothetical protein [bacterium]NBP66770.1 hypothetical protein [Bacteroidota bacterium]
MTSISFTSGELLDIISALEEKEDALYLGEDKHLAAYYMHLAQQFQTIHDKLQEFVPENRVANLVLAVN